jgi:MraZ protein
MSASAPSEVIFYNSLYRHGVDEKRRLQIPAKWRPSSANVEYTLILWPKGTLQDACVHVLPPAEWLDMVQRIKNLSLGDPKAEALRRLIGRKSDRVGLDKAGRICLPEAMAEAAGLEKEVVLLGLVDRFEIWNPERYEKLTVAEEQMTDVITQI